MCCLRWWCRCHRHLTADRGRERVGGGSGGGAAVAAVSA